jgi:hypothetical protein
MDRLPAVVEPAVVRLRELEPSAIAVLVGGSYAKGTADELSDLDLTAIVDGDGGRYRTWFQDRPGMRPLHVSAGVETIAWLAGQSQRAGGSAYRSSSPRCMRGPRTMHEAAWARIRRSGDPPAHRSSRTSSNSP